MRKTPLNRRGKKTNAWEAAKKILKREFLKAGITACEIHGDKCLYNNFLQWCHAKKRRNVPPHELLVVVLGCQNCHEELDLLPEREMHHRVMGIIRHRPVEPVPIPDSAWTY